MRIFGKVKDGLFSNRRALSSALARLEGKDVCVTVGKAKRKRTLPQNSYLWGVVYEHIREHIGYTTTVEVHEILGEELRRYIDDKGYWRIQSTSDMTIEQFIRYIVAVRHWAASFLSVNIPDPGENNE